MMKEMKEMKEREQLLVRQAVIWQTAAMAAFDRLGEHIPRARQIGLVEGKEAAERYIHAAVDSKLRVMAEDTKSG